MEGIGSCAEQVRFCSERDSCQQAVLRAGLYFPQYECSAELADSVDVGREYCHTNAGGNKVRFVTGPNA